MTTRAFLESGNDNGQESRVRNEGLLITQRSNAEEEQMDNGEQEGRKNTTATKSKTEIDSQLVIETNMATANPKAVGKGGR